MEHTKTGPKCHYNCVWRRTASMMTDLLMSQTIAQRTKSGTISTELNERFWSSLVKARVGYNQTPTHDIYNQQLKNIMWSYYEKRPIRGRVYKEFLKVIPMEHCCFNGEIFRGLGNVVSITSTPSVWLHTEDQLVETINEHLAEFNYPRIGRAVVMKPDSVVDN